MCNVSGSDRWTHHWCKETTDQCRGKKRSAESQVSRLYLTDFVISIERGAKSAEVKNAFVAGNIDNKWKETSWAKKLAARAEKAAMNDFARFKAHYAKKH